MGIRLFLCSPRPEGSPRTPGGFRFATRKISARQRFSTQGPHDLALSQQGIFREFIPVWLRKNWTVTNSRQSCVYSRASLNSKIAQTHARLNASTKLLCLLSFNIFESSQYAGLHPC